MPVYDCGDADCEECKRAFGPDRQAAIANYKAREEAYAKLEERQSQSHPHPNPER